MGKTKEEIENHLFQCNGTDHLYKHLAGLVYTDGIRYLAEHAGGGSFWLLDLICSYQPQCRKHRKLREFQVWVLKVDLVKKSAVITCSWDSGEKPEIIQEIEYSDFPLEELKLYVENDTIVLPSER